MIVSEKELLESFQSRLNHDLSMKSLGLPRLRILWIEPDRTFYTAKDSNFLEILSNNENFERWDLNSNHGPTAGIGWREKASTYSLQIVVHAGDIVECDIDYFNPNHGLYPLIMHGLTCIFTPKVNPFRVYKALIRRWSF